jgi:hypothetical protein
MNRSVQVQSVYSLPLAFAVNWNKYSSVMATTTIMGEYTEFCVFQNNKNHCDSFAFDLRTAHERHPLLEEDMAIILVENATECSLTRNPCLLLTHQLKSY